MSNDLITMDRIDTVYPTFREGFRRAAELFDKIHSFDDIETYLLRGAGLSPETYRCYLQGVKQLYEHSGGLHPFQITPGHIERFYDDLVKSGVKLSTASNRISGLKRFFANVAERGPGYVSPFAIMAPELTKKMSRTRGTNKKQALSPAEFKRLVDWLANRWDPLHRLAHELVYFLGSSGLRISEALQLRWTDLEQREVEDDEGNTDLVWYAHFTQKGGDPAEQELFEDAVNAIRQRGPHLFYNIAGDQILDPHAAWYVIKKVGQEAQACGVINRNRKLTWSPHLLRRTYATMLYRKGVGVVAVSQLTRHKSVNTLVTHYVDDRQRAGTVLNEALTG